MGSTLDGRVALITGTGGGQGRAAAQLFAAEGAIVIGCDVNVEGSEETVRLIREAGHDMTATAPVDLGDPQQVDAWIAAAADEHGRIDILYNNASAVRPGAIPEVSDEDWSFTLRNELDIVFYACRAAWPHLVASGRGVIINTASRSGIVASKTGGSLAHAATKGGVIAMTRELAASGGPVGIRVNALSPGTVLTPTTEAMLTDADRQSRLDGQMIKRFGVPEDISGVALFMASDAASFMTGANVVVDGGYTAF